MTVEPGSKAGRKIGRPRKFTNAQIAEALKLAGGIAAGAASILSCDRSTISDALERHPELKVAQTRARENDLDFCESKLRAAYGRGEAWAVRFFLERQGRHRGWGATAAQIAGSEIKVYLSEDDMRL